jgi:hypothetical protein
MTEFELAEWRLNPQAASYWRLAPYRSLRTF